MIIKPAVAEHTGKIYEMRLGTIERTFLGIEDHGMFTAELHFIVDGGGQAYQVILSSTTKRWPQDKDIPAFLCAILETVGVESWEQLKGKKAFVLRDEQFIRGIVNANNHHSYLITEDWFADHE